MDKILIDTDVILDFFFDRQPFSENASRVLSQCETGRVTGHVTPVIASNVYYLLRQTAKHEKVVEKLSLLFSFIEVITIDKGSILQALNSEFKDFEDALQNYSAENSKEISVIITRNTKDFRKIRLPVMTPESYLKTIGV